MIVASTLALFALSAPVAQDVVVAERADRSVVTGRVELDPAAARAAARSRAVDQARRQLEARGAETLERKRPFWFPAFAGRMVVDRWLGDVAADDLVRVVDSDVVEHDHGQYLSYEARLVVEHDEVAVRRSLAALGRRVDAGAELFAIKSAGTAVWWAILAFGYLWFDRLTRGYMSWRLRLLCVGMGVAAPGIAFLFV